MRKNFLEFISYKISNPPKGLLKGDLFLLLIFIVPTFFYAAGTSEKGYFALHSSSQRATARWASRKKPKAIRNHRHKETIADKKCTGRKTNALKGTSQQGSKDFHTGRQPVCKCLSAGFEADRTAYRTTLQEVRKQANLVGNYPHATTKLPKTLLKTNALPLVRQVAASWEAANTQLERCKINRSIENQDATGKYTLPSKQRKRFR